MRFYRGRSSPPIHHGCHYARILFCLCLFVLPLSAASYTIASGEVKVTCPLTVGGSFEAHTKQISGSLTSAGLLLKGTLTVDLRTLETGISIRDHHLKDTYLEVQRFPQAAMSQITVGALEGKTRFTAMLGVHGIRRQVEGTATISPSKAGVKVQASFPFRISEFGIAQPTFGGVGVSDTIQIAVSFTTS